jgi:hypothetical protein
MSKLDAYGVSIPETLDKLTHNPIEMDLIEVGKCSVVTTYKITQLPIINARAKNTQTINT